MSKWDFFEYGMLGAALGVLALAAFFGVYALLGAALLLASLAVLHYSDPYLEAILLKYGNITEKIGMYEISGEREVATRKEGGKYIATACVIISVKDNSGDIEKSRLEELISRLAFPFKFTIAVERLNTKKMLDSLQTKKGMKEIELSRIGNTSNGRELAKSMRLKREIEILEHEIKSISTGSMPLKVNYYAITSAESDKKFMAEEQALLRARELATSFDGAIGTFSAIAKGSMLKKVLMFDMAGESFGY
ncbi:MAG: hypothetical protein ACP5SJ_00640 [Candidatus Micrarchaeia archaeon]